MFFRHRAPLRGSDEFGAKFRFENRDLLDVFALRFELLTCAAHSLKNEVDEESGFD